MVTVRSLDLWINVQEIEARLAYHGREMLCRSQLFQEEGCCGFTYAKKYFWLERHEFCVHQAERYTE